MKLISQGTTDNIGMFDVAICFKPFKGNDDIDHEAYLNEICQWIVDSFTGHFVVLEKVQTIVAGGYVDNRHGWEINGSKANRKEHASHATYELRCSDVDAFAFLLKWQ